MAIHVNRDASGFLRAMAFHQAMGLPAREPGNWQVPPTVEERILRAKLLLEETLETITNGLGLCVDMNYARPGIELRFRIVDEGAGYDPIETLDGLADVKVIANGTAVQFGLPMEEADREVFESNMSKLDENGKPIINYCISARVDPAHDCEEHADACRFLDESQPAGKLLKPATYHAPNIRKVLGLDS